MRLLSLIGKFALTLYMALKDRLSRCQMQEADGAVGVAAGAFKLQDRFAGLCR